MCVQSGKALSSKSVTASFVPNEDQWSVTWKWACERGKQADRAAGLRTVQYLNEMTLTWDKYKRKYLDS